MTVPDLDPFAAFLARRFECTHVIVAGHRQGDDLSFRPEGLEIVRVDLDRQDQAPVPDEILERSIVVCADVFERFAAARGLMDRLRSWMDLARVGLVAAPERNLVHGSGEFEALLRSHGFTVPFLGRTVSDDRSGARDTILAVLERTATADRDGGDAGRRDVPRSFRATAIVPAYNEQDIIAPSLRRLIGQGLDVYVIDNWSTDATYEIAAEFAGHGLAGIERYPAAGPAPYFDWRGILRRMEKLSLELESDWFLFQSVDEVRQSPWTGVSLLDAFYRVDTAGFNAVDFTVVEFHPTDDGYPPGTDFEAYFRRFDFGRHPAHFVEINAWKNLRLRPTLAASGGHEAAFEGRRIYPFKFLLKHYPVRSQEHGERKVLRERKLRWSPEERADNWHSHYDSVAPGHSFLRDPRDLQIYDEQFERQFLVERLSGVGLVSSPDSSRP